jgi:hypothetical protein
MLRYSLYINILAILKKSNNKYLFFYKILINNSLIYKK